jgi:hypothetical protein
MLSGCRACLKKSGCRVIGLSSWEGGSGSGAESSGIVILTGIYSCKKEGLGICSKDKKNNQKASRIFQGGTDLKAVT